MPTSARQSRHRAEASPVIGDNVAMDGTLIRFDGSSADAEPKLVEKALADGDLLWLDLRSPGEDGIAMLGDTFHLHPLAIEDVTDFGQRPKVEDFGDVVYQVSYGVAADGVTFSEIHFFIAENYLVTVSKSACPAIDQLIAHLNKPGGQLPGGDRPTRLILLHHLFHNLIDSFFPKLSDFDDQIDDLQERIFAKPSNDQLAELFDMQRWLVEARKLISPQRDMMASLVSGMVELPGTTPAADPYLRDLYDHLIRISDMIDSYRDLLSNAMSVYLSMVSNNLNEVMKQLAIIATVFLPLSFLTGFFGQNFAWLVGKLGSFPTFMIVGLGTELVAVIALYWLFQHRGWIGRPRRRSRAANRT
jgi:magnesium transporter